MKKLVALLLLFGIVGCASNIVPQFPIAQYVDDRRAVELHFACIAKVGLSDDCIQGLYLDYEQVYEAFGDFTISKGGLKKETKYMIRLPKSKYLFSPYGKGRMGNGAYDKFINVNDKTCVTIQEVKLGINIFARVKDNQGSWVSIDCSKFDEITKDFDQVFLKNPVTYTDKIL